MAFIENYTAEEFTNFFDVPDGDYTCIVKGVRQAQTKDGRRMLEIGIMVGNCSIPYVERLVEGESFNKMATVFFDAFKIQRGDFEFRSWIGKQGRAHFEHQAETYTDRNGFEKTIQKCVRKYFYFGENNGVNSAPMPSAPTPTATPTATPMNANAFPEDIVF